VKGYVPIPKWKFAALQYRTASKGSPKTALLALKLLFSGKPIMRRVSAFLTDNSFPDPILTKMIPALLLIGKPFNKFYKIHGSAFFNKVAKLSDSLCQLGTFTD
jgi:hypothetical protein